MLDRTAYPDPIMSDASSPAAQLMAVIRRRWYLVVVLAVLGAALSFGIAKHKSASYSAQAKALLRQGAGLDALAGAPGPTVRLSDKTPDDTDAQIAQVDGVSQRAAADLRDPAIDKDRIAGDISVAESSSDRVLTFTAVDADPNAARAIANAYARAYAAYRFELQNAEVEAAQRTVARQLRKLAPDDTSDLAKALRSRADQLAQIGALRTPDTTVIETAASGSLVPRHTGKKAALGLIGGLVVGLMLALVLEGLDPRARSGLEVADFFEVPLLGRVARARRTTAVIGREPAVDQRAEAYRALRAVLLSDRIPRPERALLITSPTGCREKSDLAAELAYARARAGEDVILVDLDLNAPHLDAVFGDTDTTGLVDVITQRTAIEDVLRTEYLEVGRLRVLHMGFRGAGIADMAAGQRLDEALSVLSASADVVICDCTPLLAGSGFATVARREDATILLVADGTPQRSLAAAREALRIVAAPLVGVVFAGKDRAPTGRRLTPVNSARPYVPS